MNQTEELVGQVLADTYRIERLIGAGGMGDVFLATHTRIPNHFAIKVLSVRAHTDSTLVARFRQEAMIGSRLGHDHIAKVMDFAQMPNGAPYIVMELLEGEDLSRTLAACPRLPLIRAASIVRQVCLALISAHAEDVIHRDLKPENIFLCRRQGGGETVKVMDFGISKVLTTCRFLTQKPSLMGTPNYMSPEQAQGRSDELDQRTDIFSLGLIFYQMLAGRLAFDGDKVPAIIYQVVHEEPPSLQEVRPDLPGQVARVVHRAIRKPPQERFPSVKEMLAALELAMGEEWRAVLVQEVAPTKGESTILGTGELPREESSGGKGLVAGTQTIRPNRSSDHTVQLSQDEGPPVTGEEDTQVHTPAGETLLEGSPFDSLAMGQTVCQEAAAAPKAHRRLSLWIGLTLLLLSGVVLLFVQPWAEPLPALSSTGERSDERSLPSTAGPAPDRGVAALAKQPDFTAPAQQGAQAPARSSMALRTIPPGAVVLVDGKRSGLTPMDSLTLPPGARRLELRKPGYRSRTLNLTPGLPKGPLTFSLPPLPASVRVVALGGTRSVKAVVYLNGRRVDETPAVLRNLPPGRYTLRVVAMGFKPASRTVQLKPGMRRRVVIMLEP